MSHSEERIKIAKFIASAGIASRRKAEELVLAGLVTINGKVNTDVAVRVGVGDEIIVSGQTIKPLTQVCMWIFHKPRGVLTSRSDPEGREVIYDLLPKSLANAITIGRLDYNTEGLLLLTNNGALARQLELPVNGVPRTYRVRIFGHLTPAIIEQIGRGVTVDGVRYKGCNITVDTQKGNSWVTMVLTEGKNREIRKIFENFGIRVSRLIRTGYGPFSLEGIAVGKVVEVPQKAVNALMEDLKHE